MRILILEDNEERNLKFIDRFGAAEKIEITDSVDECIKFLKEESWDVLFLDHDLGGKVYVASDGDAPTGWHVAKFLGENEKLQPQNMIIHSLNPVGAENMRKELPMAMVVPFAWEKVKMIERK